jgi:DNA-binding cell septation regulator SpoVG
VLKLMPESAIKVVIFPAVRKRKKAPVMDTQKTRMALFQEGENDVYVSSFKIPVGDVQTNHNVINDSYLKVGSITVSLNENNGNNIIFDAMPMRRTFVGGEFRNNHHNIIDVQKSNLIDTLSKSRTTLIQGRENDELINHQVHSTKYVEDSDSISVAMSKKKIFIGANLCNNEKKIDDRSCVLIGSILLKIKEPKDHVRVPQGLDCCEFCRGFLLQRWCHHQSYHVDDNYSSIKDCVRS